MTRVGRKSPGEAAPLPQRRNKTCRGDDCSALGPVVGTADAGATPEDRHRRVAKSTLEEEVAAAENRCNACRRIIIENTQFCFQ